MPYFLQGRLSVRVLSTCIPANPNLLSTAVQPGKPPDEVDS